LKGSPILKSLYYTDISPTELTNGRHFDFIMTILEI
jgi:hypothetical protein